MHVLHVLDFSPAFMGGIGQHLTALAEALKGNGDRLTLAFPCYREWFEKLSEVAEVIEIPQLQRPVRSGFRRRLKQLCLGNDVDLIHLHFSFAMPFSLALGVRRWPLPIVYHWHNPPVPLIRTSFHEPGRLRHVKRWLSARLGGPAARVTDSRAISRHVVISSEIERLLVRHRWTNAGKVFRLPNAVKPLAESDLPHRRNRSEGIVIGSVANFRPEKDHVTLLQAFRSVRQEHPSCRLVLIGDGPTRAQMEQLAVELGMAESVEFVGYVPDPGPYYAQFDIFVLSSHYEGQGLVLLEAMNHSLPVVATEVGGIPDVISDGMEGFLAPRAEPESFSRSVLTLAKNPSLRLVMGKAGRRRILRDFSMDRWASRLVQLYESMLSVDRVCLHCPHFHPDMTHPGLRPAKA